MANLRGTSGRDDLRGTSGGDTLTGLNGNDVLHGNNGNDRLYGGNNNDRLYGGGGNDLLRGQAGDDRLYGQGGNDRLYGGGGDDQLKGQAGNDLLKGQGGGDRLYGGGGNDRLYGGGGNDYLHGGAGNDQLYGGGGDDVLVFDGSDTLNVDGGAGVDTLLVNGAGVTIDLISDGAVSNIELIDLTGSGDNSLVLAPERVQSLLSSAGSLRVDGNGGDAVFSDAAYGVFQKSGSEIIGVNNFIDYQYGPVQLQVQDTMSLQQAFRLASLQQANGGDGGNGFIINGEVVSGQSGGSVSYAGDVNGDGFADLIIGAPVVTRGADIHIGESYLIFGKAGGFATELDITDLDGSNGMIIRGIDGRDLSGESVSSAGDINGDGFDDVIIGAPNAYSSGYAYAGESYVVFGKSGGFASTLDLGGMSASDGFILNGIAFDDRSGTAVSTAGDFNGDGVADIIIDAPTAEPGAVSLSGQTYIVFGDTGGFGTSFDLSSISSSTGVTINGVYPLGSTNQFRDVASAGDINGDGFDDIIIGSTETPGYSGRAIVIYGTDTGFSSPLDLSGLTAADGLILNGIDNNDHNGVSVAAAGDVNGDGIADIIIGAEWADPNGVSFAGESYVVFGAEGGFGSVNFDLTSLDGNNGFVVNGIDEQDISGNAVSSAGDVNGDGYDDILIGAPRAEVDGNNTEGHSYVIFGKGSGFDASINLSDLNDGTGFVIQGIDAGGQSGGAVAAAGDVNGDGFDDLIIGARYASPGGAGNEGESYVIFGKDFRGEADLVGTTGDDTLTGTGADEILIGGLGNDVLNGGGGNDVLKGAAGDDILVFDSADTLKIDGGSGIDTLRFDGAGESLDLTGVSNLRYTGIEKIDLTGSGNNTLTLDIRDVLALPDHANAFLTDNTRQVLVEGDAGDQVNLALADNWIQGTNVDIGGTLYTPYTHAAIAAQLLVNADISQNIS